MQQFYRVNLDTGLFIEPVPFDDGIIPMDEDIIITHPPEGLNHPKWDFELEQWVEGKVNLFDLEEYKQSQIDFLTGLYEEELTAGFTAYPFGIDTPIEFGYDNVAQNRFDKRATHLSLNPNIDSIDWGTKNAGFIIMNREQFISVLNKAAEHESNLAFKLLYAEASIKNATDKVGVDAVEW
jgi:hypothetical protein